MALSFYFWTMTVFPECHQQKQLSDHLLQPQRQKWLKHFWVANSPGSSQTFWSVSIKSSLPPVVNYLTVNTTVLPQHQRGGHVILYLSREDPSSLTSSESTQIYSEGAVLSLHAFYAWCKTAAETPNTSGNKQFIIKKSLAAWFKKNKKQKKSKINMACTTLKYIQKSSAFCIVETWSEADCLLNRTFLYKFTEQQRVSKDRSLGCSWVAFIIAPGRHPRLRFKRVLRDFSVFTLWTFFFDPHGVVTRDAVILQWTLEESTLGRVEV